MKRIPIAAGRPIAEQYGYDQVIIIARKVGPQNVGGEHVTTFGVDVPNCAVAAKIGDFIKHKIMGVERLMTLVLVPGVVEPAPIAVGDGVRWNGQRYEGRVVAVNCESAVVLERHNFALGHAVKWRLLLKALTRIE